jgi:hypothetical protein
MSAIKRRIVSGLVFTLVAVCCASAVVGDGPKIARLSRVSGALKSKKTSRTARYFEISGENAKIMDCWRMTQSAANRSLYPNSDISPIAVRCLI